MYCDLWLHSKFIIERAVTSKGQRGLTSRTKIECNLEQKDNKRLNRKNIISYGMKAITESELRAKEHTAIARYVSTRQLMDGQDSRPIARFHLHTSYTSSVHSSDHLNVTSLVMHIWRATRDTFDHLWLRWAMHVLSHPVLSGVYPSSSLNWWSTIQPSKYPTCPASPLDTVWTVKPRARPLFAKIVRHMKPRQTLLAFDWPHKTDIRSEAYNDCVDRHNTWLADILSLGSLSF